MENNPYELKKWSPCVTGFDSWSNYIGPDWSAWYVGPVSQNRDSGCLERSNFEVVSKDLLALNTEVENDDGEIIDTVQIHRFGHWGPGWYEIILIHPSNEEAQKACYEWHGALANYPVADDMHFSDLECEEITEYWANAGLAERLNMIQQANDGFNNGEGQTSIFASRHDQIPDGVFWNVREHWDY